MTMFTQTGGLVEEGHLQDQVLTPLQPHTILLKDGETVATMYPIPANADLLPVGLLAFLLDEFNMEIEKGDSFPYYETLSLKQFKEAWFHADGHIAVMVLGEVPELDYSMENDLSDLENNYGTDIETMRQTSQYKKRKKRRNLNLNIQWEKQCLGIFSLQPAYPGRSSHIVTGTFLVNAGIRGKRIGRTLVETFIEWSKRLGFTSCYFPLIYGTNVGIRRILESLNFKRIGKLPESGILKGFDVPVDSFIYGKEFTHITKSIDLLRDPQKTNDIAKYERLKYYLETGKYPANCDRNEKARLRVSSRTHSVLNGKLMTRGREIVFEPDRQRQIAMEMHAVEHQGINKITTRIVERYHWKGIKNTVSEVIAQCHRCKMRHQDGVGVIVKPGKSVKQAHMFAAHSESTDDDLDHSAQLSRMAAVVVGSLQADVDDHESAKDSTPADAEERQSATPQVTSLDFDKLDKSHNQLMQPMLSTEQSMNAFNRFMEEEQQRKRRKFTSVNSNADNNPENFEQETPGTVPVLDKNDQNLMDDAILGLQENVMAAVELAHKGRTAEQTPDSADDDAGGASVFY
ncbi:hypothetical protein HG536_0F01120 [Torulaspora globosa]|uniref:N-acetyltransferase domain-containing protein n=1 Tax=Torulaspora globosa TaxID=48254 RepID=A0A7G3ZJV1_9SACH|nr:uncharacterized protein HG536_0F01120 [Torulaspora globosa]QLL33787.1 hypothetical protein HG536_0F01120 [Torulaspora globosa]